MRRIWGRRFKPGEQFAFGWKRLETTNVVMDSVMLGPWEFTLYRIDGYPDLDLEVSSER